MGRPGRAGPSIDRDDGIAGMATGAYRKGRAIEERRKGEFTDLEPGIDRNDGMADTERARWINAHNDQRIYTKSVELLMQLNLPP